jgi:chemotaxis protein methyltransferase WspC
VSRELDEFLARRFGWSSTLVGQASIDRYLSRQPDGYLGRLSASAEEQQRLAEDLRVPESWFFREPQTIEEAVAALPREPLRVLSLACSRGEEPYTLAVRLLEAGHEFTVDAVDLSQQAIEEGRRGLYSARQFRGRPGPWCVPEGDGFRVAEEVRQRVRFRCANALAPEFPPPDWCGRFHLVFCRNMLIYFDRDPRRVVLDKLHDLLGPNGLLALAACEFALPSPPKFTPFGVLFRKGSAARPPRILSKPKPARTPVLPLRARKAEPTPLELAEARADAGEFPAALELCDQCLLDGPSPQVYFLMAMIRQAMREPQEAIACLRRVLYLDPSHVQARRQMDLFRGRP